MTISVTFEAGNTDPRIVRIRTTSTFAEVTTAGWYKQTPPNQLQPSDKVEIYYADGSGSAANAFFDVSITAGVVTLSVSESNIVLPVVSGDFAIWSGTSGALADLGYSPTDPALLKVTMFSGTSVANALAVFADTAGSLKPASTTATLGFSLNVTGTVTGSTGLVATTGNVTASAGNIVATLGSVSAATTVTGGTGVIATTGNVTATAGNLIAGNTAGGNNALMQLFPTTATTGSLRWIAAANGGNFNVDFTNASHAQSTVYTVADIGAATGGIPVATTAIKIKSVAGAAAAGGAAAQSFTDAFCTSGSNVIGNWNTQANAASVLNIVPGNGSFVVTSSADAGVGTFNYIITK